MKNTETRAFDAGIILATLAIMGVTFVLDVIVPLGRNLWLAYFLAMVLSYASRCIWLPGAVAVGAAVLLASGAYFGPGGIDVSLAVLNRSLASLVLAILAGAGTFMIRSRSKLAGLDWEQRARVRLSQALEGNLSREDLAARGLEVIGDETSARAAMLWELSEQRLSPVGSWGGAPREAGQGTPGHLRRAIDENRILQLSAPGEAALNWGSGLLQGSAAHSVIVPLVDGGHINGVAEFGFDRAPDERVLSLLEQAGAKLGLELRSAVYREELRELLEETRRQAEELRAHGEEMAATNAELEEQTRALQISEGRLRDQQAELEEQNALLEQQTAQMEEQRDAIALSRRQLADQAEELARESRYKSEFVANMSHELRTPLNALLIMARLLSENRKGNLTEEQCQWAETIESSGKDLLTLINDILDIARIEAGKVEITPAPVAAGDVLRRLSRIFTPQAADRGLVFAIEAAETPLRLITDGARLEQILRNFIANALKFTQKGGVTLGVTEATGEGLTFWVRDTGIGIAPEHHAAVFDAFRQADGSISRRFGGTGLGLSISRDLAARLGGSITLESAPGQGSTFRLHLPLSLEGDLPPAEVAAAPPVGRPPLRPLPPSARMPEVELNRPVGEVPGISDDRDALSDQARRLLIVEDDINFARLLLDLARELGFSGIVVSTADDAIRAAQLYLPHGIVLDVGLPDHSGMTVLDRLKRDAETRHIPVHIVSAEDRTREALAQGAVSYLLKPVARDALITALESISHRQEQSMRKLLIVEDDPQQLSGLKALLGSAEVEVNGVSTSAAALAACRRETFDCIVLDMTLPDGSGFDLLEQLSTDETASFPPVIVYTARALTDHEEQKLRRYSRSIIIKGAKSPERLIDEVTLFLHQVVSDLPARQREMLVASLNRDAQLEGRRILIVEDDIRNIYALNGVLEPHGVKTKIARNGREALDFLEKVAVGEADPVDLVLMDVMMPEMDGLTATREIRRLERWRSLPIIMLTAKAMADDQAQCLAAGANDYLAKPLDVDKLLSLTRVWMSR
ncbi:hybrid sensor histidine kinase/response regulator [Falsigemmobacter faecalis]|uniref:histidine kinase n=1 Tax=Falsigemmobacter faecalis TaxID=2488730 RepID=A0A3P3DG44_9RHOB|nr:response regulator [Falsigemmobacter faecalis]RRH73235.1 response regulator [Falsigemmobacter faecalis]